MSLSRQLLLSALAIMLLSSAAGAVAISVHSAAQVALEMDAARTVSQQFIERSISGLSSEPDPGRRLEQIVGTFDGDRHVSVTLISPGGVVAAQSTPRNPRQLAPAWFFHLVSTPFHEIRYGLPPPIASLGTVALRLYPENEVAEAWTDALLTFQIEAVFFALVITMVVWLQRRALRPLIQLKDALVLVGAGHYETRIGAVGYSELQPVLDQFNAMTSQLARVELQKNQLQAQIQRIQDDEGAVLARDLHDEVAPFLVAVSTDAALIRHSLSENAIDRIGDYADTILKSVGHMQRQLRDILARLRGSSLAEMGLANGVDALVEFWQERQKALGFTVDVPVFDLPDTISPLAFRIVQEAVTNAVRHGKPSEISIWAAASDGVLLIEVEDDGDGLPPGGRAGFGITGMVERARSVGGTLEIVQRVSGGTRVQARLPLVGGTA